MQLSKNILKECKKKKKLNKHQNILIFVKENFYIKKKLRSNSVHDAVLINKINSSAELTRTFNENVRIFEYNGPIGLPDSIKVCTN